MDPLGPEIRSELARFGPQAGMAELVERWPGVVGDAIARNAWPARIARDGTVHVNTADSVWGFELAQRAAEIAAKLEVPRLRFAPGPLPEPAEERVENVLRPTPQDEERARAIAAVVDDDDLRERVQKAVGFSLARGRGDPSI